MRSLTTIGLMVLVSCNRPLYATCATADECAEAIPEDAEGACLDKSESGFCTWTCSVDTDCTVPDDWVCASFESEPGLYCFPSCEGVEDDAEACPPGLTCRSTGGGSDNRKVCFPEG